jgi:hypothetical protein
MWHRLQLQIDKKRIPLLLTAQVKIPVTVRKTAVTFEKFILAPKGKKIGTNT